MNAEKLNREVYVARNPVVKVTRKELEFLKQQAQQSEKRKCRLLLHKSVDEHLHEMLIVHLKGQYICPHKNIDSDKSHHVIEGRLAYVIFDDNGQITDHFTMDSAQTDSVFMTRLSEPRYHTMIPLTETVAYIETILGPFKGATYAPWAPEEQDIEQGKRYLAALCQKIGVAL